MRDLKDILAARIQLAGITRRQLDAACKAVPEVRWTRLPLFTDLTFDGEALQDFLAVRAGVDLDTFTAVYEEFIAGFLLTRELASVSPMTWLTKNLALAQLDAAQLFSDGVARPGRRPWGPRQMVLTLVALAALARYTYGGVVVYSDPTRYTVGAGPEGGMQYGFGVIDGKPVSNLARRLGPRVSPVRHQSGLVHSGRGRTVAFERPDTSVFAQLAAFDEWQPGVLGETGAGVKLALSILRHRTRGQAPRSLVQAVPEGADPAAFRQALRLAAGFVEFREQGEPYREVRALLVPGFLKADEFRELFGHAPRGGLSAQRAQQFRLAFDHLQERIKEAT